jgi:Mn2+/Fe2+ NRAMP family transporter
MLMTNNRRIMGERVNGLGTNVLGWTTTAVIFLASLGLLASWLI